MYFISFLLSFSPVTITTNLIPMIGQVINNYVLERELGEGGMGDVYLARHNRIDRIVAIKVLHRNLFANEGIRSRFKNEANALIKLGHPNIVRIYDYVEQDEFACLIMEYINGLTLDEYIGRITGPLSTLKATGIICNVLDAVQYAHDNHIFHRDIKPGNIMVSRDGQAVRVMDFGIAKLAGTASLNITHANVQLGTPFYMSPEQVKGTAYTAQSDIYSLGVTLFEMVTGKCPYLDITNLFELQTRIVNEPLPPTGKYYPDVPARIQEAIRIATNKAPEQRFKSCNEFKAWLLEEEKPRPVPMPVPIQSQPVRSKPLKAELPEPPRIKSQSIGEEKKRSYRWIYLLLLLLPVIGFVAYRYLGSEAQTIPISNADSIHSSLPADSGSITGPPLDTPVKNPPGMPPPTGPTGGKGVTTDKSSGSPAGPNDTVKQDLPKPDPPKEPSKLTKERVSRDLYGQKLCDDRIHTNEKPTGWSQQAEDEFGDVEVTIEFRMPGGEICKVNVTYKNENGVYKLKGSIFPRLK